MSPRGCRVRFGGRFGPSAVRPASRPIAHKRTRRYTGKHPNGAAAGAAAV